jgi:hypothetical protein
MTTTLKCAASVGSGFGHAQDVSNGARATTSSHRPRKFILDAFCFPIGLDERRLWWLWIPRNAGNFKCPEENYSKQSSGFTPYFPSCEVLDFPLVTLGGFPYFDLQGKWAKQIAIWYNLGYESPRFAGR